MRDAAVSAMSEGTPLVLRCGHTTPDFMLAFTEKVRRRTALPTLRVAFERHRGPSCGRATVCSQDISTHVIQGTLHLDWLDPAATAAGPVRFEIRTHAGGMPASTRPG